MQKLVIAAPSEAWAQAAMAVLGETDMGDNVALAIHEQGSQWFLELYPEAGIDPASIQQTLASVSLTNTAGIIVSVENVPDEDWVSLTQRGLAPVRAGRFLIYGSHDRPKVKQRRFAIEIDAGRAFGTAHHATTRGCLLAVDYLARTANIRTALDLGVGSGILAIAMAQALQAKVLAIDVDHVAVEVARTNCLINGVGSNIECIKGNGRTPSLKSYSPFDAITANIHFKPLLYFRLDLSAFLQKGGYIILSGFLVNQARPVQRAYQDIGFHLVRRFDLEEWSTLLMQRRS